MRRCRVTSPPLNQGRQMLRRLRRPLMTRKRVSVQKTTISYYKSTELMKKGLPRRLH